MATKTFSTDFSLNRRQAIGLDKAIDKANIVKPDMSVNAKFYGKDDSKNFHKKFDGIFG